MLVKSASLIITLLDMHGHLEGPQEIQMDIITVPYTGRKLSLTQDGLIRYI